MKTIEEITEEIRKIAPKKGFPLTIETRPDGIVTGIAYESSWLEGSIETKENSKGQIEHTSNYKKKSLTKTQIEEIDLYINSILSNLEES